MPAFKNKLLCRDDSLLVDELLILLPLFCLENLLSKLFDVLSHFCDVGQEVLSGCINDVDYCVFVAD